MYTFEVGVEAWLQYTYAKCAQYETWQNVTINSQLFGSVATSKIIKT
jgi:hypothetical protein